MTRYPLLFVPLVLIGCSLSSQPQSGAARRVTGQLSSASLAGLDNPAIVMRTAQGERRVVHVARTGEFKLDVPVGKSLHLSVASTTASGGLRERSTINWPHKWGRVDPGAPIALGVVHSRGQSLIAATPEHHGEKDDAEGLDGGDDDNECRDDDSDEPANAIGSAPVTSVPCNTVELCEENESGESDCDAKDHDVNESLPGNGPATCAPPTTPPASTPPGSGNTSSPCTTDADCRTELRCFQSKCVPPIP